MWLSKKMAGNLRREPTAEVARMTGSSTAQGSGEYRDFALAAPGGIADMPPDAARAVLVNSTEGMVCAGAVVEETALEPGELLLFSQGGARIYLKNSGEVVINGQVFAAEEGE